MSSLDLRKQLSALEHWRCLWLHNRLSDVRFSSFVFCSNFIRMSLRVSGNYNPIRVMGYVLCLHKGLYNPNRVVIVTTLRACETSVRVLMPL